MLGPHVDGWGAAWLLARALWVPLLLSAVLLAGGVAWLVLR